MSQKTRRLALIATVLTFAAPPTLSAQTIRGTVIDSATSSPVSAATIELIRQDNSLVAEETSDDRGRFRLRAKGPGEYRIRVQRIGYRAFESVFGARGDTTLVLRIEAVPVELAPVGVTADLHPYLKSSGFYARQQGGVGNFVDPATVEKLAPKARVVADMLDHIPGVSVITPQTTPSGGSGLRVPHLRSCRTVSRQLRTSGIGARFSDSLSLYPRVYLDGVDTGNQSQDTFGMIQPNDILAMEVYIGAAQIPLQYGGTDAPCGVIMIWTKR